MNKEKVSGGGSEGEKKWTWMESMKPSKIGEMRKCKTLEKRGKADVYKECVTLLSCGSQTSSL